MDNLVDYLIGIDDTIQMILEYIDKYAKCGEEDCIECNCNEGKHYDNEIYNVKNDIKLKFNGHISKEKVDKIMRILNEED